MTKEQQEPSRRAGALQRALAATVRRLRKQNGVAQETLAIEAGVARSHMSSIERGLGNPTLETIHKLLLSLGINFAQFGTELDRALAGCRKRGHRSGESNKSASD
jgi:transcriptional regulator with XRE-family HTH domain